VLTATDGSETATLTFLNFDGTLDFSSDGDGGTLITDPPAAEKVVVSGNDNFIFHPSLGADAGIAASADHTAELERLTSAQAQHWSPIIGNDAHDDAIDFVHHGDAVTASDSGAAHWHLALYNAVHLY